MSKLAKMLMFPFAAIGVALATSFTRTYHLRAVRQIFQKWIAGRGSLFDLMTDEALIVIPGTAAHCGSFSKSVFVKDVATPFMARFDKPPTPRPLKIWSDGNDVAVLAEAEGTTRDGKPYANNYVFILEMRGGHIAKVTEFLDMEAFNDVWNRVEPAPPIARRSDEAMGYQAAPAQQPSRR